YYKYDKEIIQQRMKLLIPVAMRIELKEGINNCLIINDYYNSDINSLGIALEFLANQSRYDKKTVILSDILQSGKNEESLYSEVATLVHTKKITKFIGIGETISRHKEKFKVDKYFYKTTEEFINSYPFISFNNESILLKGARFFKFEMISNIIEQKSHSTVLEINLNSLIHNYNYYKSQLQAGTKIIAMVKAFSYGCGSYEIAQSLQFHNVNYLAVAYTDEGVELRKAGISCPIIVMNPQENSFDAIFKYNLQPEIYNFRILNILLKNLKHYMLNYENAISIHIKLDTGMHRLGFEEKDIDELINILKNNRQLRVESVFSHLAAAYDNTKDDFTLKQIELFTLLSERVIEGLAYPILRHILSSVGIIRFPQAAFDMVRPGIGLYGIPSTDKEKKELLNVGTLKTVIYQVKTIKKGESIGYGADCIVNRETKIGIIPVGYADGLSRRLSNGKGKLFVNGCIVPVIGKICMDMTFIDITDIKAEESDEVIIFGKDYPISNIAEQLGTIPYEVLTNVSRRVKRVFFKE
ncbi:MAG: alanine racemase, partial [Bacteroidales bacterium]|nr:alanine racemase [Bacteroidales bacterium]